MVFWEMVRVEIKGILKLALKLRVDANEDVLKDSTVCMNSGYVL